MASCITNEQKIGIRLANDPHATSVVKDKNLISNVTNTVSTAADNLNQATTSLVDRTDWVYSKAYEQYIDLISKSAESVTSKIDGVAASIENFSEIISKNLEPTSDFMGSTLGTLTGILANPLGPQSGLGNVATNLLNNVSPGFGDKVNGSIQNLNLENMVNLPTQLFSSADHMITAVDNILAIPLSLMAEVYYGYMAIMKSLSKLLSGLMNSFQKLFMSFLDSIIPISTILGLLSQISTLSNQIGGISTTFLGANQITQYSNDLISYSQQFGGFLNNPLDLIVSKLPTDVTNAINVLENPQQLINDFLPPQLSKSFATISKMTGFGFNGNMGFGFESVLQGVQGGVIRSIVGNYAQQYDILAPLLAGAGNANPKSYILTLLNGLYNIGLNDETKRGCNPSQYSVST